MASPYATEPPSSGLVSLVTTKGEILLTLFPKEAPLACRNFLTLALEGFYDNLLFHRLIPNFIIQSGDPSGTGTGGESIYGSPFPIEPHSRLKFNRRGLLGMAAEEKECESQFFLTLDATPELQGKHTLFGKVVGEGIYTLMELGEGVELVGERPRYPIRLLEVKVLEDPFGDLKPRITKEEKIRREQGEKEQERREREELERKGRRGGKKNTKLLSFGAEEDEEAPKWRGAKSSHDLLKDEKLSKEAVKPAKTKEKKQRRTEIPAQAGPSSIPEPAETVGNGNHTPSSPSPQPKPKASSLGRELLSQQRSRYSSKKEDPYEALLKFQSRLRTPLATSSSHEPAPVEQEEDEEEGKEYGASDDDADWRNHRLDAGGEPLVAGGGGKDRVEDYEVLDPRDHKLNGKNRVEEGSREGKRGRDWVESERRYRDHDKRRNRGEDKGRRDERRRERRDERDTGRYRGSSSNRHHRR